MKKSVFVLSILFLASAFSFASGSADAASSKAAATDAATDVKIDFRMNIAKQDY